MYWTATLILEASLQFDDRASFISMASATLGKTGALITWASFLMLFYSLVGAYLSGSGRIMMDALEGVLHFQFPPFCDILPLLVIFAPFIYFGLSVVDHLNRYLMIGMLISYVTIIIWLLPRVSIDNLLFTNWQFSLLSFSVVVTSFGYHVIIPTLVSYLDRDVKSIKRCLFFGSFVPLVIYFLWEVAILGSVSVHGAQGLAVAFLTDEPLARILRYQVKSDFIAALTRGFSIFAIVTSFLGVTQGLFDFLKDGLNAKGSHRRRLLAFILTFLPPVILVVWFEQGFIALLEYAGALVSIILGIIPILIVWKLRATRKERLEYRALGNKMALSLGIAFFAFVVLLVLLKNLGFINFSVTNLR
jgi:tyrosine-specific transport protein